MRPLHFHYSSILWKISSRYCVYGTDNYVKQLVSQLMAKTSLRGRNISFDRLYTNIPLARWLYEMHITISGTLQNNRIGIPAEIKEFKSTEEFSSEIYWEKGGYLNLLSYVAKTSKGKKNILLLATTLPLLGTTKDNGKKKLLQYKLYDFTKGGTDIIDQKMGFYTTKSKSHKWTITAFSYVLDMARVNASTIFALNKRISPSKADALDVGYCLMESLVKPHVERRSTNGLSSIVQ